MLYHSQGISTGAKLMLLGQKVVAAPSGNGAEQSNMTKVTLLNTTQTVVLNRIFACQLLAS